MLLGPNLCVCSRSFTGTTALINNGVFDYRVDDDGGDGKNAKIVTQLLPDRDYFAQIQTFDPKGGKFEFSITSW